MNSESFAIFLPFLFFPAIFGGVTFLIAKFGGWHALVEKYALQLDFPDSKKRFQSARFGMIGKYNNCLIVGINQFGIAIKPIFPFSFFHPPLFFPWEKITSFQRKKFLFTSFIEIKVEGFDYTIQLTTAVFDKYSEYVPHKFQRIKKGE